MLRLKDKIAIVTGGGAGIGKAVASSFAREGARVVIAEIDPVRGESAAHEIRGLGGEVPSSPRTFPTFTTYRRWSTSRSSGLAGSTS